MAAISTGIMELPAEITESIIDCLYDDRETLKNCALTHSSWLHRTRHHLHKSVSIDSNVAGKLAGYYDTGAAAYIQNLTLIAPPQPYGTHRRGAMSERAKPFWQTVSRFTDITDLTLVFFNWRGPYKSYDGIAEIARNVTHLTLVIASFDDVADFVSFLAIFPSLVSLSVSSLSFSCSPSWGAGYSAHSNDGLMEILEAPAGKHLRSVRFANTHPCPQVSEQLGRWLSGLPQQVVPKSSLTWTGAGSVHGLIQSLRGLGPNLADIELDAASASKLAHDGVNALHTNTSIEAITFRDLQYIARDEMQWLFTLLSQVSSPSFHKLVFVCTASCFEGVDDHSLEMLDEFLSTPAFSGIDEVTLEFASTLRQADIAGMVKRGLRRLDERGALRPVVPTFTAEAQK